MCPNPLAVTPNGFVRVGFRCQQGHRRALGPVKAERWGDERAQGSSQGSNVVRELGPWLAWWFAEVSDVTVFDLGLALTLGSSLGSKLISEQRSGFLCM